MSQVRILPRASVLQRDSGGFGAVEGAKGTLASTLRVYVAAYCGLRRGELYGLRRRRVDLDRALLTVAETLRPHGTTGPKKTHQRRPVPIPPPLVPLLREHMDLYVGPDADAFVFTAPEGGPMHASNFYRRVFRPAALAALGPDPGGALRFHDLRHTAASLAIASGAGLKEISDMLGHSTIALTADRYGHLAPGGPDALAARMGEAFVRSLDR